MTQHLPLHITLRLVAGLPSLREKRAFRVVRAALGLPRAGDARVIHYSVRSNHLHFIVETSNRVGLARGMQALTIRVAKRLNRLFGRAGRVFADRFHARVLKTPLEVRRALAYVLNNYRMQTRRDRGCACLFAMLVARQRRSTVGIGSGFKHHRTLGRRGIPFRSFRWVWCRRARFCSAAAGDAMACCGRSTFHTKPGVSSSPRVVESRSARVRRREFRRSRELAAWVE